MSSPRVVDLKGIVDADTGVLIAFAHAGIPATRIPFNGVIDATVADLATPGAFDGQIIRLTDAGGNRAPEMVWNAALSRWFPRNGKSLMHSMAPATFAAAVNMRITLDQITFKADLFNLDLGWSCDFLAGIGGAPTAVTHKVSLGASADIVNWTGTTSRELARRLGFRNMGAQNSQRWTLKDTNNEYDAPGAYTGNRTTSAVATNVDVTLTNLLQFTNTSQAGAIEYCNYYLTSGGL